MACGSEPRRGVQAYFFNRRHPPARLLAMIRSNIVRRARALSVSPSSIATVRAVLFSWGSGSYEVVTTWIRSKVLLSGDVAGIFVPERAQQRGRDPG
jgi:hypothetical protein